MIVGVLALDVLMVLVGALLYGGAVRAAMYVYSACERPLGAAVASILACVVFVLALIFEVAILHRVFPKPTAGRHKVGKGAAFWGWILNMMLRRLLYLGPLKSLLFSVNILRYLSLRALGCKLSITTSMSNDVDLLDPCLTELGPGTTLGARVFVSAHYFEGNELVIAPITIGRDVLFAVECICGPGCIVGDRVKILGRASLSVFCKIGNDAKIHPECLLDAKVVVEPGEDIPARTHRKRPPKSG